MVADPTALPPDMRGPCYGDPNPPNSEYHMNLQQARFRLSGDFAARLDRRYRRADAWNHTTANGERRV